jgi:hypothetical protein
LPRLRPGLWACKVSPALFGNARREAITVRHSIWSSLRSDSSSRSNKTRSRRKVEIKRQHWISQSNKATRTACEFFSDDGEE